MKLLQKQAVRRVLFDEGLKARLVRGGLGSAGIQAANRALALALGIVLARSLGAEGYGIYAYAFAVLSLLMVAAEAGVPTLLMREVAAAKGRHDWSLLHGVMIRGAQFVMLVGTAVSLSGLAVLGALAENLSASTFYTYFFMLLLLPVVALVRVAGAVMRGLHHVVTGQLVGILRPVLVLLIVAVTLTIAPKFREPYYPVAVHLVAASIVLVLVVLLLRRILPPETLASSPEYRSRLWFKSALPFTMIGGAGIINSQADLIMLGWFLSAEDVGIYRVAVQGATLVTFGLQAANAVVAPHFARLYARGEMLRLQRLVTGSARLIVLSALPFSIALILFGGDIAAWVFGSEFSSSRHALAILAFGQLLNATFGSVAYLLNMTGHEKDSARWLWFTAGVNVVLNAVLIPVWGLEGAAAATAFSLLNWNILLYWSVRRKLNLRTTAIGF